MRGNAQQTVAWMDQHCDIMENKRDVLLWPDDFWCFRDEHRHEMLRGCNYRAITEGSPEWVTICGKSHMQAGIF